MKHADYSNKTEGVHTCVNTKDFVLTLVPDT